MLNPVMLQMIIEVHQNHLSEEVEKSRLPKAISPAGSRFLDRLLIGIGDILISAGLWLQSRTEPAMCVCLERRR